MDLNREKTDNILLLVENPRHLEPIIILELSGVLRYNYTELFGKFIVIENNAYLEFIFKETR